jgi:hypothetical protein
MGKTWRAVISGSRLFNTVFGIPRNGENITRSLAAFQSGPLQARLPSIVAGQKSPVFGKLRIETHCP